MSRSGSLASRVHTIAQRAHFQMRRGDVDRLLQRLHLPRGTTTIDPERVCQAARSLGIACVPPKSKASGGPSQAGSPTKGRRKRRNRSQPGSDQRQRREAEDRMARLIEFSRTMLALDAPATRRRRYTLHCGPANSGKSHEALNVLREIGHGCYLAPLRLLAWEAYERLNASGHPCSLVTGEEVHEVPGARYVASTIEMFSPRRDYDCVVIDEAQMIGDRQRGWAWTRALLGANAGEVHVIAAPQAEGLLTTLLQRTGQEVRVRHHERLTPLHLAPHPWPVDKLPPQTILVAFTRRQVLRLKTYLESRGQKVSVIYGALPPDVRRRQAERFLEGKTTLCVATDAIGLGMNLPAHHVCFTELTKYDGMTRRLLTAAEFHQIAGRAGRYGHAQSGQVGAINHNLLARVAELYHETPRTVDAAHLAPTPEALEALPGTLVQRLTQWRSLTPVPTEYRDLITSGELDDAIRLAEHVLPAHFEALGLERALTLVSAPVDKGSESYWMTCLQHIVQDKAMPLPANHLPDPLRTALDLETAERAITHCDIYLWLGNRKHFQDHAPEQEAIRRQRENVSRLIDRALLSRTIRHEKVCSRCGVKLDLFFPYGMCDLCHHESFDEHYYR